MTWLQGGPFLEVSFLIELQSIQEILDALSEMKVEIVDDDIDEKIAAFNRGYLIDDENPQSNTMHTLNARLYVYLSRKRKASLHINQVSSNALMMNFVFYGSEFDALEWEQVGIAADEMEQFTKFLAELFAVYHFKVGGIAFEQDILSIFNCDEIYPDECYRMENVSPVIFLQKPITFIELIWNEKYERLSNIPYEHQSVEPNGIFMKIK